MTPVVIGNATLYLGDCREVLNSFPPCFTVSAVITDPPWDAAKGIPGADDPRGLFSAVVPLLNAERVVVQLGCDSDPSFLAPLAAAKPFLRTCWLEYACPSYKGRLLHTGDVAYAYGEWPVARKGAMVIPGRCVSTKSDREFIRGTRQRGKEKGGFEALAHPMPRRLQHVVWLTNWFCEPDGSVMDPFMGSGTTGVACVVSGRKFIGIEIHEPFFDLACERIENAQRQTRMFA
jgi:site-specific DNA-methyltransferase (adenine-specific)